MSKFTKSMSYQMLDGSSSVSGMIKKSIVKYRALDVSYISAQMIDMEETPLNREAMKLVQGADKTHEIKLMNYQDEKVVSSALPFATYRSNGKLITNVYVDNIGKVSGDRLVCPSKSLYAVLGSAYIANSVFDSYGDLTNRNIMIPLMNIYSDMVIGIFNVLVHARADKKLLDLITYGTRRFFLEWMLGLDANDTASIAIKDLNNIDQGEYEKARIEYDDIVGDGNLEKWLQWIKKLSPKTKDIDKKLFITRWLRQYGEFSYFAMDNVEYLISTVMMTLGNCTGYSRSLQMLIKQSKYLTKLNASLYTFTRS